MTLTRIFLLTWFPLQCGMTGVGVIKPDGPRKHERYTR